MFYNDIWFLTTVFFGTFTVMIIIFFRLGLISRNPQRKPQSYKDARQNIYPITPTKCHMEKKSNNE